MRIPTSYLLLLTSYLISGCGWINNISNGGFNNQKNPDVYHVGEHHWAGDTIFVHVYKTSEPGVAMSGATAEVECRSCNIVTKPFNVNFDNGGNGRIYIPEARALVSTRIHVLASGIDTTIIQKQRPAQEAGEYFHLDKPLAGRVFITQFAPLYHDRTQDSVESNANVGDEVNIYSPASDTTAFYEVHHPNFRQPLYLLKENAVRMY